MMGNILLITTVILLLGVYMMMFWYWIRTLLIMGQQSILLAILGFLFSPIAQIIYYVSNKNKLSIKDKKEFSRYWLSIVLTIVISIMGAIVSSTMPNIIT